MNNNINVYSIICNNSYNDAELYVIQNFLYDEDNHPQIVELTGDHNREFYGIYIGTARGASDGDTPVHVCLFVNNGMLQVGFSHNLDNIDLIRDIKQINLSKEARMLLKKIVMLSN